MSKCNICHKENLLPDDGLCASCDFQAQFEMKRFPQMIVESINVINNSKNKDTIKRRCELIIKRAAELEKYEWLGMLKMDPSCNDIIKTYKRKLYEIENGAAILNINIPDLLDKALEKNNLSTAKKKIIMNGVKRGLSETEPEPEPEMEDFKCKDGSIIRLPTLEERRKYNIKYLKLMLSMETSKVMILTARDENVCPFCGKVDGIVFENPRKAPIPPFKKCTSSLGCRCSYVSVK